MLITKRNYSQWAELWSRCHSPKDEKTHVSVMDWAKWAENMLGPDNICVGFVLKDNEYKTMIYYIGEHDYVRVQNILDAQVFSWDDTACKITTKRKLEAIRIDLKGIAQDSSGLIVAIYTAAQLKNKGVNESKLTMILKDE